MRANGYITCVVAGVDSASDADTSEAVEMLTEAADSTTSGACFVRLRKAHRRPHVLQNIYPARRLYLIVETSGE